MTFTTFGSFWLLFLQIFFLSLSFFSFYGSDNAFYPLMVSHRSSRLFIFLHSFSCGRLQNFNCPIFKLTESSCYSNVMLNYPSENFISVIVLFISTTSIWFLFIICLFTDILHLFIHCLSDFFFQFLVHAFL